ncbi:MAG: 16S rRNA (guanine(966)-N(2))-methyltransferase RsmD [Lachnospiraceae bacterium]|nr:16S rRNA (guanine(966)-N(2))-methyltransferase RsmD [Lachnospiraceae bacterium]
MRVIAGKARRLQLKTIEGKDTRPTQDRTKETLFNVLQPRIPDAVFLDLFSGSGAIGIEALSRYAKEAWFVENGRKACECIRTNLEHTNLTEDAHILMKDALSAVSWLEDRDIQFDVIFMDPPYDQEHEKDLLFRLGSSSICTEDTLVAVEASLHTDFSYVLEAGFEIIKEKKYKTNQHVFLERVKE